MPRRLCIASVMLLALVAPALAVPLEQPQCVTLESEQKVLEAEGVEGVLAKGPEWAKANLAEADRNKLVHYLDVKELVLFRCPSLRSVVQPDPAAGDTIYGPPELEKSKAAATKPVRQANKKPSKKAARKAAAPVAVPAVPVVEPAAPTP